MSRPFVTPHHAAIDFTPKNAKLLVAVSGGVDSVVLLHVLASLKRQRELELAVVHVNHKLREESDADAAFVRKLAGELSAEYFEYVLEQPPSTNIESWGRGKRYECFRSALTESGAKLCLTAHHAGDVAETFLLRLLRNRELRPLMREDPTRRLLRPFVETSKEAIYQYAEENRLAYREDKTNASDTFERNLIRNQIIPFLEKAFDSRIIEVLAKRALALEEDELGLDQLIARQLESLNHPISSEEFLKELRSLLSESPSFLHWRIASLLMQGVLGFRLGREKSQEVIAVVQNERIATELPGRVEVRRAQGRLVVSRQGVEV